MAPTAASLVFVDEPAVVIPLSGEVAAGGLPPPAEPRAELEARAPRAADDEIAALFEGGPMAPGVPMSPVLPIARTPLPPMFADRPQVSSQYARELATGSSVLLGESAARAGSEMGAASVGGVGSANDASSRLPFDAPRGEEDVSGRRRRAVPIGLVVGAGLAAASLLVIVVLAMWGGDAGDDAAKREAAPAKTVANSAAPEHAEPPRSSEAPAAGGAADAVKPGPATPAPASGSSAVDATTTPPPAPATPTPPATTEVPAPVKKPAAVRKLGGKRVVLEYDSAAGKQGSATTGGAKDDSAAVAAARITYFNGNRRLFAGDASGAIKLYQQALAVYPGYVAGYRGLGLAYTQKGEKANALKAFRTYVGAVPGAKDVGLIRQRIATLQKK